MMFKRIRELLRESREATVQNEALLADAERQHMLALEQDAHAEAQALTLVGMDQRNHYSESLTHAFRRRTA